MSPAYNYEFNCVIFVLNIRLINICALHFQNALAQVVNGRNLAGRTSSGNSVVSNNIAIGNLAGLGANNLASNSLVSNIGSNLAGNIVNNYGSPSPNSVVGNSAVANNIGISLGNAGGGNLAYANNLAVGNLGGFANNFAANNLGSGLSIGGLSSLKIGDVEVYNDLSTTTGYSGEYPVIGYVTFEGYIPASGTVSVANEGCGCS